jgi:hypothetical protein
VKDRQEEEEEKKTRGTRVLRIDRNARLTIF